MQNESDKVCVDAFLKIFQDPANTFFILLERLNKSHGTNADLVDYSLGRSLVRAYAAFVIASAEDKRLAAKVAGMPSRSTEAPKFYKIVLDNLGKMISRFVKLSRREKEQYVRDVENEAAESILNTSQLTQ